jgi:hypothetical protein
MKPTKAPKQIPTAIPISNTLSLDFLLISIGRCVVDVIVILEAG